MHVGATLQLLRVHAGLSLRALASEVGVSAAWLSRVEHGHDPAPTPERAAAIAAALGLPEGLVTGLVDEVRGDGADLLKASPTGRRLVAELAHLRLGEAQLARVLSFVHREFPADGAAPTPLGELLDVGRVHLGVRLSDPADAWTVAALKLADRPALDGVAARTAAVGGATIVSFSRAGSLVPRASLVLCDAPLAVPTPDGRPAHAVWLLAGLGDGPEGARVLTRVARLADERLVHALLGCGGPRPALALLERFERGDPITASGR